MARYYMGTQIYGFLFSFSYLRNHMCHDISINTSIFNRKCTAILWSRILYSLVAAGCYYWTTYDGYRYMNDATQRYLMLENTISWHQLDLSNIQTSNSIKFGKGSSANTYFKSCKNEEIYSNLYHRLHVSIFSPNNDEIHTDWLRMWESRA